MTSPFAFDILLEESRLSRYDQHIERRLSSLRGQYADAGAYQRLLESGDPIIYEVYEISRPEVAGELRTGLSVVHAGHVGGEYFMTKGHFHAVVDTAETYYCVKGRGLLRARRRYFISSTLARISRASASLSRGTRTLHQPRRFPLS